MSFAPRRALNPWPVLVVGIAALVMLPVALMAAEALTSQAIDTPMAIVPMLTSTRSASVEVSISESPVFQR